MRIVVDTNIVFSAILNSHSKIGDLLLNSSEQFDFFSCDLLREEINRHRDKLLKISEMSEEELAEATFQIFNVLTFISDKQIPFDTWYKCIFWVKEKDMDDLAFVALSEFLDAKLLWTGDLKLLNHLRSLGYTKSISTQELFDLREKLMKETE